MSFAEVLAAARELTADERKELLRELAEPLPIAGDGLPDHLRQFLPPSGAAIPYWKPDLTAEGWEQVQQLLAKLKGTA